VGHDRPVTSTPSAATEAGLLADLLAGGDVVALTGAGMSTEPPSSIPDYRGPTGVARGATPMTYQELLGSPEAQRRYWARSFAGWPVIRRARPNAGHAAVARLQELGAVGAVITQNVDRLHQAAGADPVVDLHGTLDRVVCLTCRDVSDRDQLQHRLAEANPGFDPGAFGASDGDTAQVRPDGDVELVEQMVEAFRTVPCLVCGQGPLKPDVVFFGENVPKDRVARCYELVDAARVLLVLGSSLTVMSGYRFVRHAARLGREVAIVNQGTTRGEGEATVRVDAPLGPVLTEVVARLESR
jgi:NAD-dependent SIR2 family protein deacetylase